MGGRNSQLVRLQQNLNNCSSNNNCVNMMPKKHMGRHIIQISSVLCHCKDELQNNHSDYINVNENKSFT